MIIERARLTIRPELGAEFETIFAHARAIFLRARGCAGVHFERVVETPEIYVLVVQWGTIEDHMVHFRASDDFTRWRELAGPYFAQAPEVEHLEVC